MNGNDASLSSTNKKICQNGKRHPSTFLCLHKSETKDQVYGCREKWLQWLGKAKEDNSKV
jgi:hypothetical protein